MRYLNIVLACFFLLLAAIGLVLPLVPTVPFLLLAAWFSARGSKRLHRWLYAQPYFGKVLKDWDEHKAVSRKSKILAISTLLLSWGLSFLYASVWVSLVIAVIFIAVSTFLWTRPEPR